MNRYAIALLAAIAGVNANAHHSAVMYEEERTITLEGVVKEFQYTNPHSWLLVDVTNAEGPTTLLRAGIRIGDLSPGTELSITGRPMKDGRPAAAWHHAVRKSDGRELNPRTGFSVNRGE